MWMALDCWVTQEIAAWVEQSKSTTYFSLQPFLLLILKLLMLPVTFTGADYRLYDAAAVIGITITTTTTTTVVLLQHILVLSCDNHLQNIDFSWANKNSAGFSFMTMHFSDNTVETSQQVLDGLPWNFVQTFMVTRRWTLMTLVMPWLFLQCHRLVNISTTIGWGVMKYSTDVHALLRINLNDFCDPLTFHLRSKV